MSPPPVIPPPEPGTLSASLSRNIEALAERRRKEALQSTREEKVADTITGFAGSMRFVYVHLVLYGGWILINLGLVPFIPQFDPSFVILAMEASVEAIFLSTFILISQNRMSAAADKRADLDLQISLLAEHEITKLTEMVAEIAERLEIRAKDSAAVRDAMRDVAPERVLDEIEAMDQAKKPR
jgi:uncharacterized membrane protein